MVLRELLLDPRWIEERWVRVRVAGGFFSGAILSVTLVDVSGLAFTGDDASRRRDGVAGNVEILLRRSNNLECDPRRLCPRCCSVRGTGKKSGVVLATEGESTPSRSSRLGRRNKRVCRAAGFRGR